MSSTPSISPADGVQVENENISKNEARKKINRAPIDPTLEEMIIDNVYRRPWIWNSSHRDYRDSSKRSNGWKGIAEIVGMEVDDLKNTTWKSIQQKYRREKTKLRPRSGLQGPPRKSSWAQFEIMRRIMDGGELGNDSSTNLVDDQSDQVDANADSEHFAIFDDDAILEEQQQESDQPPPVKNYRYNKAFGSKSRAKPDPTSVALESVAKAMQDLGDQSSAADEWELFGRMIAIQLRKLEPEARRRARNKIMHLMDYAEQGLPYEVGLIREEQSDN